MVVLTVIAGWGTLGEFFVSANFFGDLMISEQKNYCVTDWM